MGTPTTHASNNGNHSVVAHPELPEINDDTPPTAEWLPWTGLVLFLLLVIAGLVHSKMPSASDSPSAAEPVADAAEPSAEPSQAAQHKGLHN